MGIFGWLTVLFVGLKLTDFIDWSWVWVLAPTWVPLFIALVLFVCAGFVSAVQR